LQIWYLWNKEPQIIQKSTSHPKILCATAPNLVAQETWHSGFVHPYVKYEKPLCQTTIKLSGSGDPCH
jgi:hypothetical protein